MAVPVNWPAATHPARERPAEVIKAQAAAATNGIFVAVADRCQAERGVSWISGSLIAGPDGYPLAGPVLDDRPAVLTIACDLQKARDKSLDGDNDLLADRRPALYVPPGDERVAAANAHWAARFIANGTSYSDFTKPWPASTSGTTGAASGAGPPSTTSSWPGRPRRPGAR